MTRRPDRYRPRPPSPIADTTPASSTSRRFLLLAALLYAGLAAVWTWPLARHLASAIPIGSEPAATVPLLNLWTLWWNVDRIAHLYAGYWDAPIFHPAPRAFALSEPQPLAGVFAAAGEAAGLSRLAAYNLFLLLSLTLNGCAAAALVRAVGARPLAAVAAGALATTLPFVHRELGVLQLVPVFGILWSLHALWRVHQEPTHGGALVLGAALAATGGLCAYYGLFLGVLLVPACLLLLPQRGRRRRYASSLVVASLAAGTLLAPLAVGAWRAAAAHGMRRSEETRLRHSAHLADYARAPWAPAIAVPGVARAEPGSKALFPGLLKTALALAGLLVGLRTAANRRFAALCAALLLLSVALSLGPATPLFGLIPGAGHIRSPFRFAAFAQLNLVLLAALGVDGVVGRFRSRVSAAVAGTVLAALAVAELRPPASLLQPLPPLDTPVGWIDAIETHTRPEGVLAFLPFPEGRSVLDYLGTSQWMYWQMRHGRRMVNGYSGFFPETFLSLKAAMRGFPDERSIEALADRGVSAVVVPRFVAERTAVDAAAASPHRLRWRFGDDRNGIDVYALESTAP